MLLQIFVDAFRLAHQERDMQVGNFEEMLDHVQGLLEFLRELFMLLVAPGVAQTRHLRVQARQTLAQIAVELLEMMGETPKLQGIHDCLRHACLTKGAPGVLHFHAKRGSPQGQIARKMT